MVKMTPEYIKPRDYHNALERDSAYGFSGGVSVNVGVASVIVLRVNPKRKQAIFVNDSDTVIYLTKDDTARLNAGIRLNANGGSYIESPDTLGYLWRGAFAAISSAALKLLLVTEDQ